MSRPPAFPIVLAGFTAFLDLYATQPLLPLLMRVFHATHFAVSLTITVPTVAVALVAPAVGRLADTVGRKRVIVASAFLLTAATALAATAHSLPQLIAWRLVQGLLAPGIFAITIAYVHDEWPRSHAGRGTAAYVSGTVVGGFLGRALVGLVAADRSWEMGFLALAGVNLAAAVALALFLPPETHRPRQAHGEHRRSILRLVRNRQLIATNAVGFCVLFTQVAMFSYVTFHLSADPYALSTRALGWLFVVYLVGAGIMPAAGRFIDRRGHRAALASGMAVGAVGAFLTLTPWLAAIVTGLALVAAGVFISQATASSYVGIVTAEDRGLAVGIYSSCYYAGGSLGGALPAAFWNAGGWTACVALVIAVQAVAAGLATRFWKDTHRHAVPLPEGMA